MIEQGQVIMAEYEMGWAARAEQEPEDEIMASGVNPDNIRYRIIITVQY